MSQQLSIPKKHVRRLIAQQKVLINHQPAGAMSQVIGQFDHVQVEQQVLQANTPVYIVMHKPVGVISATQDDQHTTVFDLLKTHEPSNGTQGLDIEELSTEGLHIVGRLDKNTSGMLLLTNDGEWSRRITSPESKISKRYHVTLRDPITDDYIPAFLNGMHFSFENITTLPAKLTPLSTNQAQLEIMEGKYHQIKRMFGRFRNPVLALHREAIGKLTLDPNLLPGQFKVLTENERLKLC